MYIRTYAIRSYVLVLIKSRHMVMSVVKKYECVIYMTIQVTYCSLTYVTQKLGRCPPNLHIFLLPSCTYVPYINKYLKEKSSLS